MVKILRRSLENIDLTQSAALESQIVESPTRSPEVEERNQLLMQHVLNVQEVRSRTNPDSERYDPELHEKTLHTRSVQEQIRIKQELDLSRSQAAEAAKAEQERKVLEARHQAEVAKAVDIKVAAERQAILAEAAAIVAAATAELERVKASRDAAQAALKIAEDLAAQNQLLADEAAAYEEQTTRLEAERIIQAEAARQLALEEIAQREITRINERVSARIAHEAELEARRIQKERNADLRQDIQAKRAAHKAREVRESNIIDEAHEMAFKYNQMLNAEAAHLETIQQTTKPESTKTADSFPPNEVRVEISPMRAQHRKLIAGNRAARTYDRIETADARQVLNLKDIADKIEPAPFTILPDTDEKAPTAGVIIPEILVPIVQKTVVPKVLPENEISRRHLFKGAAGLIGTLVLASSIPTEISNPKSIIGSLPPKQLPESDIISLQNQPPVPTEIVAPAEDVPTIEPPVEAPKPPTPTPEKPITVDRLGTATKALIDNMKKHGGKTWDDDPEVLIQLFRDIAAKYNNPIVTAEFLSALAYKESRYDRTAQNTKSSAGGLGQFINRTWQHYGRDMNNDGRAEKTNALEMIDAMARLSIENYDKARTKLGDQATPYRLLLLTAAANLGPANISRHGLKYINSGPGKAYADDFYKIYKQFNPNIEPAANVPAKKPEKKPTHRRTGAQIIEEGKKKYNNVSGKLTPGELKQLAGWPGHSLAPEAADAFLSLNHAYQKRFGKKIGLSDSYRSLSEQVRIKNQKPSLAADPGTSYHGWGTAIDLDLIPGSGNERLGSKEYKWMQKNARKYGFVHPDWAQPDGSKPESWHWEFA